MPVTAVVLAAGRSTRMGSAKPLVRIDGVTMLDRVLAACEAFATVVVASPDVAMSLVPRAGLTVLVNAQPERGLTYSLQIAHARVRADASLLVFLADKPWANAQLAAQIVGHAEANTADVCFPVRDGIGGHPVFFSPHARDQIPALRGDSLQPLRDAPGLRRAPLPVDDDGAYTDVDSPEDVP